MKYVDNREGKMIYINERIKNTFRVPQPEDRGKYVRLDQNENPDGIPQWLFDSVINKITPEFLSIYPEETRLTEKYANKLGLGLENVTLTDGSVVGMGYAIKVFGEEGKTILCVTPSFGMYKVYGEMVGMNAKLLSYEKDFSFDVNKILSSIDSSIGIVVLVNPNMPIGNVYSQTDIEKIVSKAKDNESLVIIDEAYYYFYDQSSVNLIKKYDNVLVLRTFSKMLSIPALRMGAIISNPEIIRCINNYKPHYTVNSVALLFGEAIIDNFDRVLAELSVAYKEGESFILTELKANHYDFIPSKGCFVCIKPRFKTADEIYEQLKENGILILRGTGDLSGYLRLTIAHKEYMKIFIDCLKRIDVNG